MRPGKQRCSHASGFDRKEQACACRWVNSWCRPMMELEAPSSSCRPFPAPFHGREPRGASSPSDPTAQYLLGLMYDKGHGVPRSHVLTYKWLNLVAARARPAVRKYYQRIRDAVAAKLTPEQVAQAQWLAYHFIPMRQP